MGDALGRIGRAQLSSSAEIIPRLSFNASAFYRIAQEL
jgi:hypothetical protein